MHRCRSYFFGRILVGLCLGETLLGSGTIALGYCYETGHDDCVALHSTCIGSEPEPDMGMEEPGKSKL